MKTRFARGLLTLLIPLLLGFGVGDVVQVIWKDGREEIEINARSTADFTAGARNIVAVLKSGTRGEILEVRNYASGNSGLKIKVMGGPGAQEGKQYWIHYNPKQPWVRLLPKEDAPAAEKPVPLNQATHLITTRDQIAVRVEPRDGADLQGYLEKQHHYEIDRASDRGGPWIPVFFFDSSGRKQRGWVRRDLDSDSAQAVVQLVQLANQETSRLVRPAQEPCEDVTPPARAPAERGGMSIEGVGVKMGGIRARILALLTAEEKKALTDWLNAGKARPEDGVLNAIRGKVFRGLYSLSLEERDFVGAIWTAFAEARGSRGRDTTEDPRGRAEMISVMQVLENRKRAAGARAESLLDVALQPAQFSAYNLRDPNGYRALLGPEFGSRAAHDRSYQAYLDWVGGAENEGNLKDPKLAHYYASAMKTPPAWRHQGVRVERLRILVPPPPPPPPGQWAEVTSHLFYRGVPWTYRNPPWKE